MESLTDEQRSLFADGGQMDDYEVLKPIGKGKFSVVFKAKRRCDGQAVALKKIAIFDMMNLKAREKTLKEVRLVQSVSHPNIIQYLDAFVQNNELYIAFEWAEAGDLKRQIRKANEKGVRFDERTIWRYFTQLCGAILYLHQGRIMHRDLKPANIFLTLKGVVKVGDLGLGRYLSENTVEARSKVGTPLYMSPEVLRGESYDWKSDVWSMGCILYELAMLRSPFKSEGLNLVGLFQKINKGHYEDIPEVYNRPSVQEVRTLPKVTPQTRFDDMRALSQWLLSLLGGDAFKLDDPSGHPPIVVTQKILLAAEKLGVPGVAQISAPALTSGAGIEVCELLDALTAAVSSDVLDATDDDGHQNNSGDGFGESTNSLVCEDDDVFSRWVVVKEENQPHGCGVDEDKENAMIHSDIDPVAWELERRRMLPKLQAVLQGKLRQRPAETSWRVRLDQMQTQAGAIVVGQDGMQREIGLIQASRQHQSDQLERYEKQLNKRYLRARRLYDEETARLSKSHGILEIAQGNVNRATVEIARLQTARSEQANAVKATEARLTDNSTLLERKRQVRHLIDENRELGLKLQPS
uniref:non-specific serine/threonine protein kinase n=1 Tax=Phytophthora ramorum TaxID=164328 RepID=H3HAN9_PHYRM